jgi:sarcosine oxidase subunit gamma
VADQPTLDREGAFTRFVSALPTAGDIRLSEQTRLGIAAIFRVGPDADGCTQRIRQLLGVTPPTEPAAAGDGGSLVVAVGPGAWLALRDDAPTGWATELERDFAGTAAVVDQSSGYAVLRLEGEAVWRILAKGAFIDLDPQAFAPGHAAATLIAHIGVILWRRTDRPAFEVAVFRSYAGSFWHWLTTATEGEGLRLARPD